MSLLSAQQPPVAATSLRGAASSILCHGLHDLASWLLPVPFSKLPSSPLQKSHHAGPPAICASEFCVCCFFRLDHPLPTQSQGLSLHFSQVFVLMAPPPPTPGQKAWIAFLSKIIPRYSQPLHSALFFFILDHILEINWFSCLSSVSFSRR